MDSDQEKLEAADKRADAAKQSLRSRIREIERRVEEAKETLDVPAKISANPRLAVGIAAGAGALLGLLGRSHRSSTPGVEGERSIGGAIIAALGALAFQAIKEYALREGAEVAQKWWADRVDRDSSVDHSDDVLRH
ncbi:MAG TPA: hypothetical protein VGM39_18170 [Kofleriaceae bacterium]|jgi:hypothetical protein